jgi:hypothetical protein
MQSVERLHQTVSGGIQILLVAGLLLAYLSALAGMAGYMDAATVAFLALCGTTVAFVAMVAYLARAELERRRKR